MKILFFPHADLDKIPPQAPAGLRERWTDLTGQDDLTPCDTVDLEHWVEHLYLLDALVKEVGQEHVQFSERSYSLNLHGTIAFGSVPTRNLVIQEPVWPDRASHMAAERYYRNPAFEKLARRTLRLADVPGDSVSPARTPADIVTKLAQLGLHRFFLKFVTAAKYLPTLTLEFDPNTIQQQITRWLEPAILLYGGQADAVLVQSLSNIHFEYRYFVVNRRIVTGSGQIEELTPHYRLHGGTVRGHDLPAWNGPFYPWVARERKGKTIQAAPGVGMLAFADEAVKQLTDADPALRDFVLDVAVINGGFGIVELNPITNSGFFATDPRAYVKAALEAIGWHDPSRHDQLVRSDRDPQA
jgi:hypothetical protein